MKVVSTSKICDAEYKDSLPRKTKTVDANTAERVKRRLWQEPMNCLKTPEYSQ
jgi:hypothetical protein